MIIWSLNNVPQSSGSVLLRNLSLCNAMKPIFSCMRCCKVSFLISVIYCPYCAHLGLAVATTYTCATESIAVALAPSSTGLGAPTCGQLLTIIRNRCKRSPEDFPLLALFDPSPVGWAGRFWLSHQCLSPHVSGLIRRMFGMLFECCLIWRYLVI